MRIKILILILAITFTHCSLKQDKKLDAEGLITEYIDALNKSDFKSLEKLFSDSIKFSEGDFVLANSLEEMHIHFQWDSVFLPSYELIDLSLSDTLNVITISKICKRIKFLHDSSTVYKMNIDIDNNEIVKMQISDYVVFNFKKWSDRRDSLLTWIGQTHPELDGFFNEIGAAGASKYSTAIDLYVDEHK